MTKFFMPWVQIGTVFLFSVLFNDTCAQSTTNASMTGIVSDSDGLPMPGANVLAIHTPSGSEYGAVTQVNGRFTIPAMRIGGPYTVRISFIGFDTKEYQEITLHLGQSYVLNTTLTEGHELEEVIILGQESDILNEQRTGAATNIGKESIESMPTLGRNVQDFTRATPQSSGTSFAGQDPKSINFTVDGSVMTNMFGLSGSIPGASTNSSPISMEAIEEIQVNIAPYDVTQSGFTGAGVNAVTRKGDNEVRGSMFFNTRNDKTLGLQARDATVVSDEFNVAQYGFRIGGPIVKNKLFFFISGEAERRSDPGTAYRANAPGREGGNVTRVEQQDLEQLSSFLRNNYGYETGPYENFNLPTNSDKLLVKLDYNINKNHTLSARFNMLESQQGRPAAGTSFGFGGRNRNLFSMNYANTNYLLNDNFYSGIVELNSVFGTRFSNNLTAGYTKQTNFRTWEGGDFPMVDILQDGRNYISFGTDILSPNRGLESDIYQIQNNFSAYLGKHTITAGVNFEHYNFAYTFTPAYFGQYVYNSLDDFYAHAAGETVELRRYQRSYSGLADGSVPTSYTEASIASAYIQDQMDVTPTLRVTGGVRLDVPFYGDTGTRNPEVEDLDFFRPDGSPIEIRTDKLPDPQFMVNPRLGFNWDVMGDRSFQLRGGTGFFTGRPIYINISNMINSNGLTLGQIREDNTTDYAFSPDVNAHIPEEAGAPETYDLSYIERNFQNPQVWRSNLGIDKKLFWGVVGTFEAIYTRQLADLSFYDANLRPSQSNLAGPDDRPLHGFSDEENRINPNVTNATVMGNNDKGYSYSLSLQLQKSFKEGISLMVAYNYAVSKNIADGNTQHYLSYENIHSVRGGNFPQLGYSLDDQRHRFIASLGYRKEYLKNMASQISLFYELGNQGVYSYVYNGDANGDLINGNDLMYVPTASEVEQMQFQELEFQDVVYSAQQQQNIFEDYINQDEYLSRRRGNYAERHGVQLPVVGRLDLSFMQEFFIDVKGKRNTLQLRVDIFNVSNLINRNWGVGTTYANDAPVTIVDIDENNIPTYQLNPTRGELPRESMVRTAQITDVWQMQFGLRYIFN